MINEFENYLDIIELHKKIEFKTLFLEITNVCNFKCKHCYNSSGENKAIEFSMEEFNKTVSEFLKYKITSVVLSGGEALLHPKIWDFIDTLRECNLDVTLLTNGKLLNDENVKKLKNKKVYVQISLDGASQVTNDFIRYPGSFDAVINALTELNNQKYTDRLSVNTVINSVNCNEVLEIIKICEKFSVATIGFSFLNNSGRAKENGLFINEDKLYHTIDRINKNRNGKNIEVKPINVTHKCRFCGCEDEVFLNPVVDVHGNIYMCEFLRDEIFSIGNIFKNSLDNILGGDPIKRNLLLLNIRRYYIKSCRKCAVKSRCGAGCIVQNNSDNYFDPRFCNLIKKNFLFELGASKS